MTETVDELRPGMEGRWCVKTESGTDHVFDFQKQTYTRFATANELEMDGTPFVFNPDGFIVWPKVGGEFSLYIPMNTVESGGWMGVRFKFRTSATITSIERVDQDAA